MQLVVAERTNLLHDGELPSTDPKDESISFHVFDAFGGAPKTCDYLAQLCHVRRLRVHYMVVHRSHNGIVQ